MPPRSSHKGVDDEKIEDVSCHGQFRTHWACRGSTGVPVTSPEDGPGVLWSPDQDGRVLTGPVL